MSNKEKYDHQTVEKKWQKYWSDNKTFKAQVDSSKPKYYILDMFPYPSGAGLHVGHVTGYTATDILARYKRQQGFNVLHPMGWDSFGLPAEQYALRTGTHPQITTEKSIDTYRRQLKSLGLSYDWDRELATSDPKYYKWTQWIFTLLYEKGLAYEAEILVNYCEKLGTVLANEEIENGLSKIGGYPVIRKPLKQWVLKITEYAERLLSDLDDLDWPDYLKKLQRNWIGKSVGATVYFEVENSSITLETFTTRVDTLFGVTFLVISPEHPHLDQLVTNDQKDSIDAYKKEIACKSDLERTELNKNKTGVWTGSYALHPITGKKVPIWTADYVIMGYGTGVVMAVPCDDERDFEFAKKFDLEITPVVKPNLDDFPENIPENMTKEEVLKQSSNCEICWGKQGTIINSEFEDLSLNGLGIEEAKKLATQWLAKNNKGKASTTYKLRDWLFSRQRYWAEPFPILHYQDGTQRALGLDELPLCPPELTDYKPAGDGQSPLAKVKDWVEITDSKTNKPAKRETNTMPQWAGSCWYYLRFCDPTNAKEAWSKEEENYWMPVDLYVGGVEHAVLHLLYARFWHKVLFDLGLVSTSEPFKSLRNQGLVTANAYKKKEGGYVSYQDIEEKNGKFFEKSSQEEVKEAVEKMSKSKLNGVTPDDIVNELGADTLRLYEMFMAPFDKEKVWNNKAISGCRRFINRFYEMVTSDKITEDFDEEAAKITHRLIAGVTGDIENMLFNTAIAKMMEFINHFSALPKYPKEMLRSAVKVLYPFAPHFAEECNVLLGFEPTLSNQPFPSFDEKYLVDTTVTYVIQVNGKIRGKFELPKGLDKEKLLSQAKEFENVKKHLDGKEIIKEIFVPDKLVNIVVR